MGLRIDVRQRMPQHGDGTHPVLHRGTVRRHIDPVCQAADHDQIGKQCRKLTDQPVAHLLPVRSRLARTDDRQPMASAEFRAAFEVNYMRIIGTLEQPPRIRLIACRNGPDAVAFAKRQLPFGRLMVLAAAQTAGQRRLQLGPPDQFVGRRGENRLRRTETLQQMDRRTAPQLGMQRQCEIIDRHGL